MITLGYEAEEPLEPVATVLVDSLRCSYPREGVVEAMKDSGISVRTRINFNVHTPLWFEGRTHRTSFVWTPASRRTFSYTSPSSRQGSTSMPCMYVGGSPACEVASKGDAR